ncbi:MAG: PelD GGDEF domain-containing protein [Granulosicoccus sp.]
MNNSSSNADQWRHGTSGSLPASGVSEEKRNEWPSTRLFELAVFALLIPIGGIVLFVSDPTGLQAGFPWVIAPPLVFAARYGSAWGMGCALVTAVFINMPFPAYATVAAENVVLGIGLCALCLFIGEVTTSLKKRNAKAEAENAYLRHRLEVFSTDYHVLKVSHGQLEEYMAGQRLSLREALQRLRLTLGSGPEGMRAGQDLMAVFAQFCSVQIAGLYNVDTEGQVHPTSIATHGEMFDLPMFDPLLRLAVEQRQLVSIKRDLLADKHHARSLLAVVPLVDVNGQVYAVLAIKDMHFMAFQQENLNLLALLGSYLGNLMTRTRGLDQSPQVQFVSELETTVRFAKQGNAQSVLLSMQFEPSEQGREIADFVCDGIRSLDSAVVLESSSEHYTIGMILPLMSEQAAHGFRARVEKGVVQGYDIALDHVMQDIQIKVVSSRDDLNSCLSFFAVHASRDALQPEEQSVRVSHAA